MNDNLLVETLLDRGEGNSIDFKLQQYDFEDADDVRKSELLKDLLAFANAWRDTTAYILIGVRDGAQELVGLDRDIDESRLQQFVSGKLNRPLHFVFRTIELDGKKFGLYEIPVQDRPVYSRKTYGNVKAETVYVRRGSATAVANPDEIARMGAELTLASTQCAPNLQVRLLTSESGDVNAAAELVTSVVKLELPEADEFPDYPEPVSDPFGLSFRIHMPEFGKNKDYYRKLGACLQERQGSVGFQLEIKNVGNAYAEGVKVTISVNASGNLSLTDEYGLKLWPKRSYLAAALTSANFPSRSSFSFGEGVGRLSATLHIGKIHAGDVTYSEQLFLLYPDETLDHATIRVHADQLSAPLDILIPVNISVERREASVQTIKELSIEIDGPENDESS